MTKKMINSNTQKPAITPTPVHTQALGSEHNIIINLNQTQQMTPQIQQAASSRCQNVEYGDKSRVCYILLAIFLGFLGIHDFYANRHNYGIAYLLTTIFTLFTACWISWIFILIEICCVNVDGNGKRMV